MFKKIYKKIEEFNTIVIARHTSPDPDAVASQIALRDSMLSGDIESIGGRVLG